MYTIEYKTMTSAPIFTHQKFIKAITHTRTPCSQNEYKFSHAKITITLSAIQRKVPSLNTFFFIFRFLSIRKCTSLSENDIVLTI